MAKLNLVSEMITRLHSIFLHTALFGYKKSSSGVRATCIFRVLATINIKML